MSIWSWLKGIKAPRSDQFREIRLRRNAPPPGFNNAVEPDLCFDGVTLVAVEENWKDELIPLVRPESVSNRLAIYQKRQETDPARFVGEQCRYNGMPVLLSPEIRESGGLPLMSFAEEFRSFDEAVEWILASQLIHDGNLMESFLKEVERYRLGRHSPE